MSRPCRHTSKYGSFHINPLRSGTTEPPGLISHSSSTSSGEMQHLVPKVVMLRLFLLRHAISLGVVIGPRFRAHVDLEALTRTGHE